MSTRSEVLYNECNKHGIKSDISQMENLFLESVDRKIG